MSPKLAFSILLAAIAVSASAQNVALTFPDSGDRQVWVSAAVPTQPPSDSDGIHALKNEASLPSGGAAATSLICVWDKKTGNLAVKSVKDAGTAWAVQPSDFQRIAEVAVKVEHSGKPVAAASIELNDGKHQTSQLLAPSNAGQVLFFGIAPGSLKVTVHYKVGGKDGKPVTQLLDAAITRTEPIPSLTISIADAVDTVGAAAPGGSDTAPAPSTQATSAGSSSSAAGSGGGGNILGQILVYLLVMGAVGGGIYYALQYVKKNPDTVGSKLEALGVQIPKPGDDPLADPGPVPQPKAPAPVQKIILDDAAPDLIAPVAASTVISDPRLVSQNGDSLSLPQGDLIVGREIGLGLSLVGESTVSRKHAQITRSGASVVVTDFGSTNGTYVNGVKVAGDMALTPGDAVQFGSVRFRFEG